MARSHSEVARSRNVAITRVTQQVNSPPIHHSNNSSSSGNHNTKEANLHLNGNIKAKTSMNKKVNTKKKTNNYQKRPIIDPSICISVVIPNIDLSLPALPADTSAKSARSLDTSQNAVYLQWPVSMNLTWT